MEIGEVETVEDQMEAVETKTRIIAAVDEDSIQGNEQESNDESGESVHEEAEIIPIVTQTSGGITYTSGNQQYTVAVPSQNVTNVKIVKVVPLPHARSEVWSYFGFIADDDGEIQDKKKAICKICASTLAYSGNTTNLFTHLKAMHPEANPQKLAPTNRTPRTGKKFGKRRYFDVSSSVVEGIPKTIALGTSSSPQSQQYILRTITYPSNNDSTSSASLFDGESAPLTPITSNGTIVKSPTLKTVSVVSNSAAAATATADGVPLVSCDEITTAIVNMLVKDCRPVCVVEGKGFEELLRILAPGYKLPDSDRLKVLVKKRYEEVRRNLILRAMEEE